MGRLDNYRRYAKECLDMATAVHDAKSRASLVQMAQVWLRLAQKHDAKRQSGSRRRARGFLIVFLGELLPSLRHLLQGPAVLLSFRQLRQAAAFLREALVFG